MIKVFLVFYLQIPSHDFHQDGMNHNQNENVAPMAMLHFILTALSVLLLSFTQNTLSGSAPNGVITRSVCTTAKRKVTIIIISMSKKKKKGPH